MPTGGVKTLLGAHAFGVAKDAWIEKDFPLVLWLVPTNMIHTQTVDALNNPKHPFATRRKSPLLNKAYANLVSTSWAPPLTSGSTVPAEAKSVMFSARSSSDSAMFTPAELW